MYGYIYITTNLVNGKIYVGQHKVHNDTFNPKYYGSGRLLRKALNHYGKENFKVELIEWCETLKETNEREIYWIAYYKLPNYEIGYNIARGGQLESFIGGVIYSEESRRKMSESAKKHAHPPTTKGRIYVNNGTQNKCIEKNELDTFLNEGWVLGRIDPIPRVPWNKGLTRETDERVDKYITKKQQTSDNGKFFRENNPRKNTTEKLYENIINKGFKEYFLENGKNKTANHYHVRLETIDKCLELIGLEETYEHKLYIIRKGRNLL